MTNTKKSDGSTALHYASFRGSEAMITLLVQAGAKVTLPDKDGRTPLHWATNNRQPCAMLPLLSQVI